MKLATRRNETRDGELIIISRNNRLGVSASEIALTFQAAMDDWSNVHPELEKLYAQLNDGVAQSAFDINTTALTSPMPRSYAWIDGSAYINHIVLVRKARGAEPPATLQTDPLVYQGGSDTFLGPCEDIPLADEAYGCDFESEIAIITGDVPQGTSAQDAPKYIRLVMLCNDVSLRNLIPAELAKSFGFFNSKPSSAFSPFAITLDELGDSWQNGRIHLPLITKFNGALFGDPDAGPEMHFSFCDLIAHVAKTRALAAGTIIGSGTVSNEDRSRGSSCIAEKRMLEKIDTGEFTTPFLKYGDRVTIEMLKDGRSLFGQIDQKIAPLSH